MKKWAALLLVLALCLMPITTAFASNHDYEGLNNPSILSRGSKGSKVRKLQQHLIDLGYLSGRVDGSYGSKTETAIRNFQRKNGITVTGVATLFTQAALYGGDALASWNNQNRSAYGSGSYVVQNGGFESWYDDPTMDVYFDFVNQDSQTVEAFCIYYWLDSGNGRLVTLNGWEYTQQWYYNCNISGFGRKHVTITLHPKNSEVRKAHELRCLVGEIAYSDGTIVTTMGNPTKPFNNRCYILDGWD